MAKRHPACNARYNPVPACTPAFSQTHGLRICPRLNDHHTGHRGKAPLVPHPRRSEIQARHWADAHSLWSTESTVRWPAGRWRPSVGSGPRPPAWAFHITCYAPVLLGSFVYAAAYVKYGACSISTCVKMMPAAPAVPPSVPKAFLAMS